MKTDSWGHPALTEKQVIAIAENMIPTALRPHYIGIDVMRQTLAEPYSEWNTDIVVYFKYPVAGGPSDESRYAHSDLFHLERDFKELYIDEDSRDEMLEDYDMMFQDDTPARTIKPLTRKIVWHKPGYNGED
jgi:hypothetical protein